MIIKRAETENYRAEQQPNGRILVFNKKTNTMTMDAVVIKELPVEKIKLFAEAAETLNKNDVFGREKRSITHHLT